MLYELSFTDINHSRPPNIGKRHGDQWWQRSRGAECTSAAVDCVAAEASNTQITYVVLLGLAGIFLPSIISTLITYPPVLL